MRRRHLLAASMAPFATSLLGTLPARAQTLPDGNVRLLWGYPPGGAGDFIARLVCERASKHMGRNILVINQAGASGRLAIDNLRRSAPDGLTALMAPMTGAVLMPMVSSNAKFDFVVDVESVAHCVSYSLGIAVAPSTGVTNWQQFLAWAKDKANAGKTLYGGSGLAGISHLFGAMMNKELGLNLEYVPFRGGADLNNAVMGNHVPIAIGVSSDFAEYHKAGRMKVVAVSTVKRDVSVPDVASFTEMGHPTLESEPWFAFFAPKGTPAPLVGIWNAAINAALSDPAIRERIEKAGFTVGGGSSEDLRKRMIGDKARWQPVVTESGIRMEE